jgi:hypothetical protein
MTVARPVITVYEGPVQISHGRSHGAAAQPPGGLSTSQLATRGRPHSSSQDGAGLSGRRAAHKGDRRLSDGAEVAVTAPRATRGAPSSAPTATSSSRPSRPPSSHPRARSGAGGNPRAAARSLDAIDNNAPVVAATDNTSTPSGAVAVQRPQPKPSQDGRIPHPVHQPINQRPPRPTPQLEPGDLPIDPVGDRAGVDQQPAGQPASPYRRDRSVVGDDRTGTCRATGNN